MQTNQEANSALERRIDMSVALADIERKWMRLKRMARTVKMAGFRPSKVPLKIVAQTHGRRPVPKRSARRGRAFGEQVRDKTCVSRAIRASNPRGFER